MNISLACTPLLAILIPCTLAMQDTKKSATLEEAIVVEQDDAAAKDRKGIHDAALDYVRAFYEAKPELLARSVSRELTKYGHYWPKGADTYQAGSKMSFEQATALAKRWNAKGWLKETAPKRIQILDQMDKTAAVKVTAYWGIDYMHLEKVEGKWMIRHVMWQSLPTKSKKTSDR